VSVREIRATGTRGIVKGKPFRAVPGRDGMFVLHSEEKARKSGQPLRNAVNQVRVPTLDRAAQLLVEGGFHIRLSNREHNQWNLRAPSKVTIVR
jgi:hypothetical protein